MDEKRLAELEAQPRFADDVRDVRELVAEVRCTREWLRRYGRHADDCTWSGAKDCRCGFNAALVREWRGDSAPEPRHANDEP